VSGTRPLTTPPYGFSDRSPSYSANGRWLAFVRSDPLDAAHVHRIDLASGEESRLSRDSGHVAGLAAEDAGTVLVAAARTGSFGLWRYRDGAAPVDMIAPGWKIHRPQVAATGEIAYETWFYDSNVWRIPAEGGGEGERLAASSQFDLFPDASPQGRIVFTSNRAGSHALWIREPDGREWQSTRFPVPASARARWAPDGRRIVVPSSHEGQPDPSPDATVTR